MGQHASPRHLPRTVRAGAVSPSSCWRSLAPACRARRSATTSYDLEARYNVGRAPRLGHALGRRRDQHRPAQHQRPDHRPPGAQHRRGQAGGLQNLRARVDGVAGRSTTVGQTSSVPLGVDLAAGDSAIVFVGFRARLGTTAAGRGYFFAKLGGVAQLYRFIPWVSRRIPFGTSDHGEPFVTPVSPRVEVTVSADRKLVWATSGRRTEKLDARASSATWPRTCAISTSPPAPRWTTVARHARSTARPRSSPTPAGTTAGAW